MKKYLALVLGVIFTLGFAASAFAIHAEIPAETQAVVAKGTSQITLGGELRFRGEYKRNTDVDKAGGQVTTTSPGENTDSDSAYDGRVRLRIQADVSKNTMGVIHLETGSSDTSDTFGWGGSAEAQGVYPKGNGKRGSMQILEAWIQHKFNIGVPAGIKIGHMPLALGNGLFFNHTKFGDDAIVVFFDPTKELHIGLLAIKIQENTATEADDADAYVALMAYKGKNFSLGLDVTMVDDSRAWITSAGNASTSALAKDGGTQLTNIGIRAETKIGGLGLKGDVELQSGESSAESANTTLCTTNACKTVKHKGYAYLVGASYKLNTVDLSLEYVYGSGDNNSADDRNNAFVTALANTQKYTYVYDYRVETAHDAKNTGITNTEYIKLGAKADITKDLNIDANLYLLSAVKKKSISVSGGNTTTGDSKKIGRELDAKLTYKLDKNLVYFVEGGYLWTGAFYNSATVASEDAYAVRHGITLSF